MLECRVAAAVSVVVVLCAGMTAQGTSRASSAAAPANQTVAAAAPARPNIVLITTDDMRRTDLQWMPETTSLLAGRGVKLTGFISNHPLCCPARAEILTGQHSHNNGVRSNVGPTGGYRALAQPGNHVATWLKRNAGYQTAFIGKHLNGWEAVGTRQPGWTVFDPILKGSYTPFDLTMYNNGTPRLYPDIHTSDLVGQLSVRYIRRFAATEAPFFVWTSQVAPHGMHVDGVWRPPVPAPRHRDVYPNALPPSLSNPAFNEPDLRDKSAWVQAQPQVPRTGMIAWHRARIRSLRSVDDQVKATVDALRATGELSNTYIFFTSDNGYLLGEHRLTTKNHPYEQSLRIPLVARGATLPAGAVRDATYSLVDLAPTFVSLAGNPAVDRTLDGRSMLATLRSGQPGYGHYLIQATRGPTDASTGPASNGSEWWWRGVRSAQYAYWRFDDGFEELYDLSRDPVQLQNVAGAATYAGIKADLAARLSVLETCVGVSCRTGGLPGPSG
jgi:N-acetylglucosamine-6-sulfatase